MENAGDFGKLADNAHAVFMCVALVDNDRHIELLRKRHLHAEGFLLYVARHVFIMIVEPDFANGLDFGGGAAEVAERVEHVVADFVCMVWMRADCSIDMVIFLREIGCGARGFEAPGRDHQSRDVMFGKRFKKLVAVFVKSGIIKVSMCIEKHICLGWFEGLGVLSSDEENAQGCQS